MATKAGVLEKPNHNFISIVTVNSKIEMFILHMSIMFNCPTDFELLSYSFIFFEFVDF